MGFLISSLSQTFVKPGTFILYVGVAGNLGSSGGNSGFVGSFSDATVIERKIALSCAVSAMNSESWRV